MIAWLQELALLVREWFAKRKLAKEGLKAWQVSAWIPVARALGVIPNVVPPHPAVPIRLSDKLADLNPDVAAYGDSLLDFPRNQWSFCKPEHNRSAAGFWSQHIFEVVMADYKKGYRPKAIVIGSSIGNPFLMGVPFDDAYAAWLDLMDTVRMVHKKAKIVVLDVPPTTQVYANMVASHFTLLATEWCKTNDAALVSHANLPRFAPMVKLLGGQGTKGFLQNSGDGVHYSANGVAATDRAINTALSLGSVVLIEKA